MTDAQRKAMQDKYIDKIGFRDGKIYAVALENTYDIKDQLKQEGARFSSTLQGWYFSDPNHNYPLVELTIDDCLDLSGNYVQWKDSAYDLFQSKIDKKPLRGGFVAEVGKEILEKVQLIKKYAFEGRSFSYYQSSTTCYAYTFEDEQGNQYSWITSKIIGMDVGDKCYLGGIVKGYNEYRGQKQTQLTKCRIEKDNNMKFNISESVVRDELQSHECDLFKAAVEDSERRKKENQKRIDDMIKEEGITEKELKDGFTGHTNKKISNPNLKKLHLSESLFEEYESNSGLTLSGDNRDQMQNDNASYYDEDAIEVDSYKDEDGRIYTGENARKKFELNQQKKKQKEAEEKFKKEQDELDKKMKEIADKKEKEAQTKKENIKKLSGIGKNISRGVKSGMSGAGINLNI